MGTFLELGKAKAAKGERWALPSISCALTPTAPMAISYRKSLPLIQNNIVNFFFFYSPPKTDKHHQQILLSGVVTKVNTTVSR